MENDLCIGFSVCLTSPEKFSVSFSNLDCHVLTYGVIESLLIVELLQLAQSPPPLSVLS